MAPLLLGILGSGVLETALGWESEDLGSSPSSATYWCGTMGKSLNLLEPQVLHLYNGDNKPNFPTWQGGWYNVYGGCFETVKNYFNVKWVMDIDFKY